MGRSHTWAACQVERRVLLPDVQAQSPEAEGPDVGEERTTAASGRGGMTYETAQSVL